MSDKNWPTETDLVRFVDQDLSPEQLERLDDHTRDCGACAKEVTALRSLVADIAAPAAGPSLDVAAHVAGVMNRLDAPMPARKASQRRFFVGALAVAAAASLVLSLRGSGDLESEFAARGSRARPALEREVGVELYAQEQGLKPLLPGSRVGARTAVTAALRNAGTAPAHLLLFAVDAENTVHWIAPAFTTAGEDPESLAIPPSLRERPLPTAAAFDDLAPGPLRIVAVVTRDARRVSEIEALPAAELARERLERRFAQGNVREFALVAVP